MSSYHPAGLKPGHAVPCAAIVIVAVYAATQLLADIASLKIGVVFGFAVDMGTFIFPITFTLRDLAHKVLGRRNARILVISAAMINLLAVLYLIGITRVPSDAEWGLGEAYGAIFEPVWRIVMASISAQIISQLINTEVYHWFMTRITRRHQWLRVLVSNTVAIPLDNLIFVLGAWGGFMPAGTLLQIFVFNFVVKYLVMLVSIPLIYTTKHDEI
jgi:queuosine precursor transporter